MSDPEPVTLISDAGILASSDSGSQEEVPPYSRNSLLPAAFIESLPPAIFQHIDSLKYPFHLLTTLHLQSFSFGLKEMLTFPEYIYGMEDYPLRRITWRNIEFALHHYYLVYLRNN